MLQDIELLYGKSLGATDGSIGRVRDFYFDDVTWALRYLVVDTGPWLSGRQLLLPPDAFDTHALGRSGADADVLRINLTRKQIENSPAIDLRQPVSRPYEEEYCRYYGWPAYWQDGGMLGAAGFPAVMTAGRPATRPHQGRHPQDAIHLRSTRAVTGYHIQTTDGPMGSVGGFREDSRSWAIRELVVETGHEYPKHELCFVPEAIDWINYKDFTVFVNLAKEDIEQTFIDHLAPVEADCR